MTMKEWAERWMEADVRPKVRPTTYEAKRYVLKPHPDQAGRHSALRLDRGADLPLSRRAQTLR